MAIATAEAFSLDALKGVKAGTKAPELKRTKTLDTLLDAHENEADISQLDYTEKDIVELVTYAGMNEYTEEESKLVGVYVGKLITHLTQKNEAEGKRTIIDIPENHLDYMGKCCEKFDIVRIGINYGDYVFDSAYQGNLLYVERCEGDFFANNIAPHGGIEKHGEVGAVLAKEVNGDHFGYIAGDNGPLIGMVRLLAAEKINGNFFGDQSWGSQRIIGKEVNGEDFAFEVLVMDIPGWKNKTMGATVTGMTKGGLGPTMEKDSVMQNISVEEYNNYVKLALEEAEYRHFAEEGDWHIKSERTSIFEFVPDLNLYLDTD